MKIQHLTIIFIIIIMPIALVFATYVDNRVDTLLLESQYDTKLLNCTYDAIKAYQLNTINNTESDVTNSKIADIEASVNAFKSSLVTAFGYSGYNTSVMDEYLPAIVYTLYDGYYIYSPYQNTLTNIKNTGGSTESDDIKTNGLKNYVYYSCRYKYNGGDFVITYTLDNSITIQGKVKNKNGVIEYVNESGYLMDGIEKVGNNYVYDGVTFSEDNVENLREEVGDGGIYQYTKLNGTKYYIDGNTIFSIMNGTKTTQITSSTDSYSYTQYKLNIENNKAAYEYYKSAYEFTKKVRDFYTLNGLKTSHAVDKDDVQIKEFGEYNIFGANTSGTNKTGDGVNYIQYLDSNFNQMRKAVIRYTIETNLRTAIASFTEYSNESTDFAMPKISETDWELIENNVSTISFLQGIKIKSKIYNGYAVVPNLLTKEFVDENAIYIETGKQYHKASDKDLLTATGIDKSSGYLNLDYERRLYVKSGSENIYYYPRSTGTGSDDIILGCYKSVSGNSENSVEDMYKYMKNGVSNHELKTAYYTALGRERQSSFKIYNDEILKVLVSYGDPLNDLAHPLGENISFDGDKYFILNKGDSHKVQDNIPINRYVENGIEYNAVFKGWTTNKNKSTIVEYPAGSIILNLKHSITLYPVWDITEYSLIYDSNLDDGDTISGMPEPTYVKQSVNDNIKISDALPLKKTADGAQYICLGWSKVKNSKIVEYTSGDTFDEYKVSSQRSYRLYAVWGEYAKINSFAWKTDASQSINNTFNIGNKSIYRNTSFDENSDRIYITGNTGGSRSGIGEGKGVIWTDLSAKDYYYMELSFDYNLSFGDSFYCAGVLIGVRDNGNYLNSSAISFNNSRWGVSENGTLWDLKYKKGENSTYLVHDGTGGESTLTKKRALNIPRAGKMTIIIRNKSNRKKNLKILIGTETEPYYDEEIETGYSFGFFTNHYHHDCSDYGQFELKNISMKVGENK